MSDPAKCSTDPCTWITPAAFILLRPEKAVRWIDALIEENSPPVDTPQA